MDLYRKTPFVSVFAVILAILACNSPSAPTDAELTATVVFGDVNGAGSSTPATGVTASVTLPNTPTSGALSTATGIVPATFTPRPIAATVAPTQVPPTRVPPTHTPVPPTPLPVDFSIAFLKTVKCNTFNVAVYQMKNLGTLPIESMRIQQEGPPGERVGGDDIKGQPWKTSPDLEGGQCLGDDASETLGLGITAFVYERAPNPPDSGTAGAATVTACSLNRMDGACVTKTITFTWP